MRTQFGTVKLDTLLTTHHHGTQRVEGMRANVVARMVAEWDPRKVGAIVVSQRPDGSHFCMDGAHRVTAAREVGVTELPAVIHEGLTRQQEADMFSGLNTFTQPSPVTRFLARVDAGEEQATRIKQIIESHGWRIGQNSDPGWISAIAAAESVYRDAAGTRADGEHPDILDWVLDVLTAAWGHDRDAASGSVLKGLAQLIGRFGSDVDTKKLVSEMAQTRPKTLIGHAATLRDAVGGTIPAHFAKVLVGLHNRRRRTNLLPEWVWTR